MKRVAGLLLLWVLMPRHALAEPCSLPEAPTAQIEHALGVLSHTPPPRVYAPPSRLRGLLPTNFVFGVHSGVSDQTGYYLGATSVSERVAASATTGWSAHLRWDLRPLWSPTPMLMPTPDQHLARAERVEHLAERVAMQLNRLRKAASLAMQVSSGDLLCQEAQADAETALLVIASVLNAARP